MIGHGLREPVGAGRHLVHGRRARPASQGSRAGRRSAGPSGGTPDRFSELARFPALEGKTWNHPVLVDNLLLIRNDHEMAAFRLPQPGDRAANAAQGAAPSR